MAIDARECRLKTWKAKLHRLFKLLASGVVTSLCSPLRSILGVKQSISVGCGGIRTEHCSQTVRLCQLVVRWSRAKWFSSFWLPPVKLVPMH